MSKNEVSAPVSSVASDRLVLGVGPARPGAGGIGGTLNPSFVVVHALRVMKRRTAPHR